MFFVVYVSVVGCEGREGSALKVFFHFFCVSIYELCEWVQL